MTAIQPGVALGRLDDAIWPGHRAVVTENIGDYAPEPDPVLVCVLKRELPSGAAQARALAEPLDRWETDDPDPYLGQHWPT